MTEQPTHPLESCADECGVFSARRAFLRDGLLAIAALTAVVGDALPLHALPLHALPLHEFARDLATGAAGGAAVLTYPVPPADGATIDASNRVIVVRYQGVVHAFSLECPHRGTMIRWQPEQSRFWCPKHKSTFKPEGTRIQGKAPRSLDRHAVRVEGGQVLVDTSVVIESSKDAAGWAAAGVKLG